VKEAIPEKNGGNLIEERGTQKKNKPKLERRGGKTTNMRAGGKGLNKQRTSRMLTAAPRGIRPLSEQQLLAQWGSVAASL